MLPMALPRIILDSPAGPEVVSDGRRLVFLGGTNYLGLNGHPAVVESLRDGATRWGISSSGSRTTSGTAAPHLELESRLRELLEVDAAFIVSSAYLGNHVLCQALGDGFDVLVADELAHSSLRDAASLLAGRSHAAYRHRDAGHARAIATAARSEGRRPLLATDAVFPTSGLLAPIDDLLAVARELDGGLLLDDAHGFGVLGERGRGTPEHLGIPHREVLLAATFSKALGCFGGFVSGPTALGDRIGTSGAWTGATPLPPAMASAALTALDLACADDALRTRLRQNTERLKRGLDELGIEFADSPMPIAQFVLGDRATNERAAAELVVRGVLVPYIHYPGGPEGGYFRMAVTAAHTGEQIDRGLGALRRVC